MLNNEVGQSIATSNPSATNVQLAGLVLEALKEGKLWIVTKGKDGNFNLQKSSITENQYNRAMERLNYWAKMD